jgi:hypothetical protein
MIRPRYNQNRIGATIFDAVTATEDDREYWKGVLETRKEKGNTYRIRLDARVVAGKLVAHPELSKLILIDDDSFTFVVNMLHPGCERKLYIIGYDNQIYVIYKRRTNKDLLTKIEVWIKATLRGIEPKTSVFTFGSKNKYGIARDDRNVLMLTYQRKGRSLEYTDMYKDWRWDD